MNEMTKVFEGNEVRIVGTEDNPLFVLRDVCEILDLQAAAVARRLDKDVISSHTLTTSGGSQKMTVINEDGLYDVILDSRKPQAKAFRKWITKDVLPSIRQTGGYQLPQELPFAELFRSTAQLIESQQTTHQEVQELKHKVDVQMTIDYGQQQAIEHAKKVRVEKIWDEIEGRSDLYDTKRKVYARIGNDLKRAFAVASYRDIRRKDFEEARNYITAWRPALV